MNNLDNLTKILIKDLLKTNAEAKTWLLENIDQLENILEIEISNPRTSSKSIENISPDVIAEENITDNKIVCFINLDPPTDKDFKNFLSIATSHNASIALWIVSEIDDQTKAIIYWLSHRTEWKTQFIIAKIEGYKIGDSLSVINLSRI